MSTVIGFKVDGNVNLYDHDHLANIPTIDSTPTENSTNAVQSGGVYTELTGLKEDLEQYESIFTADVDESVQNWLDEHPEATTTVQDGAITEAKLASSIYLDKYKNICAVPDANILLSDIGIDYSTRYTLQGGCYNTSNGHIVLAFHHADIADCIVVELDSDWSVLQTVTLTLYHANDITYNPTTDMYYVADGENTDTIYAVDSGLTTVTAITVSLDAVIAQISYDETNDRYYLLADRVIYTCDSNFGNITTVGTLDTSNDYEDVNAIYTGGSCMMGESFVSMLWFYQSTTQAHSHTRLCFANADKDYDGYYFDFRSHLPADEIECLLSLDDKLVAIGYYADSISRTNIYKNGTRKDGMLCTIGNTYSTCNRVPVNSYGVCTISADDSPTGADITGAYICYGIFAMRTLRITVNDVDYYRYCYSANTWTDWHSSQDAPDSMITSQTVKTLNAVEISANASTTQTSVDVPAVSGYTPFMVTAYSCTSPVVFPWFIKLETSSSADSGYVVNSRYRNTYSTAQSSVTAYAIVHYIRTT